MVTASLRAVGGAVMVAIPKPILQQLGLVVDATVALTVEEGRLILEPQPRPRYSLAELIAQCDLSAPLPEEDRSWETDEPVGREEF